MQRLSYPTESVLYKKIASNRIVLSFKDSPRKPLGRQPQTVVITSEGSVKKQTERERDHRVLCTEEVIVTQTLGAAAAKREDLWMEGE